MAHADNSLISKFTTFVKVQNKDCFDNFMCLHNYLKKELIDLPIKLQISLKPFVDILNQINLPTGLLTFPIAMVVKSLPIKLMTSLMYVKATMVIPFVNFNLLILKPMKWMMILVLLINTVVSVIFVLEVDNYYNYYHFAYSLQLLAETTMQFLKHCIVSYCSIDHCLMVFNFQIIGCKNNYLNMIVKFIIHPINSITTAVYQVQLVIEDLQPFAFIVMLDQ